MSQSIDKTVNIMTSTDEKLMPFVPIQILSIIVGLPTDIKINYFLLYDTKSNREVKLKNIENLQAFSSMFDNLNFNAIDVGDIELFAYIARYGANWGTPAYYPLLAYKLLPKSVDRVLYLDAGDVFVRGDFREYYFTDFLDNFLIATVARLKEVNNKVEVYDSEDLYDLSLCDGITRGVFNSGSYVMNISLMRQIDFREEKYTVFADTMKQMKNYVTTREHDFAYWGDHGFLSAFFLGKIRYYGYPNIINVLYMPFNFCLWYYDITEEMPWYNPAIIHFAGAPKPWTVKYPSKLNMLMQHNASFKISDLKLGQREYYSFWYQYAAKCEMISSM